MAGDSIALVAGWIPFCVVIVLTLFFSLLYVRYFMTKYDSERSVTVTAVIALTTSLLTSFLMPVDIFLVSFMKESDGTFKEWANDSHTRETIMNSVTYAYYTLYALVTFCLFLLIPFMYFFYEEAEDEHTPTKSRLCTAFKYTIGFVIVVVGLLLVGAFVPSNHGPSPNSTEWQRFEAFFKDFASNNGEDALSFVISCLSLIGMMAFIFYGAYGLCAFPLGLIKGSQNAKYEMHGVASDRHDTEERIQAIKNKYVDGRQMSSRDRSQLANLEESERLLSRQERHLEFQAGRCFPKCMIAMRPLEIFLGVALLLLLLLIFISLLLTNIDKAMHSLGYKMGYILPERHLPNPVDMVLVFAEKAFPIDYILMVAIILYLVCSSMSGIRNIGLWFLCIRMYKIRPKRTAPQGMLLFAATLMYIILAINVILYELTPQYSSFGGQNYANVTVVDNVTEIHTFQCNADIRVVDECVLTRMVAFLLRFFYKMWFFGAAYYWATWLFLAVILIDMVIVLVRQRRSSIQGEVEESDFEDSDDELLRP